MELIAPAARAIGPRGELPMADYLTRLEQVSLVKTLDNLMSFPWLRLRVERGELHLHAAYFGVAAGTLSIYDADSATFRAVSATAK